MTKQFLFCVKALFIIALLAPLTMRASDDFGITYNQGVIYVEYDQTTTVRLPDYLINEYNYHSAVPYDGGGTLRWSVSDNCLSILWTANFECHIAPKNGSSFPNYVTLTASFNSWYGTSPKITKAEWIVKLKEPGPTPDPNVEDIQIDVKNFPDDYFRAYLLEQDYGRDGVLTTNELARIDVINVQYKGISDLEGIQYFYGLKTLLCCYGNQISHLDMSKNIYLETLYCQRNQLEYLNVSGNHALRILECDENQLSYLDVSNNTALEELVCHDNHLSSLDVTNNTVLKVLDCGNWIHSHKWKNQLTSLDVTKNTKLTKLWCDGNQLTSLDVSKNIVLYNFDCSSNQLKTIDVRNINLEHLNCSSNQLTSLDVSKYKNLIELSCSHNQLTTLDVSNNTKLTELWCFDNQLTVLDVSKNIRLEDLRCDDNYLTTLDLSNNKAIKILHCGNNQLTSLDVSKNTKLDFLFCEENMIKGAAMDDLIKGLPKNGHNELYAIDYTQGSEGNVCTKDQVSAARNKGWTVYYFNGSDWRTYWGRDETSVNNITLNTTSVTMQVDDTILLQATVNPDEAKDKSITWSSDDTSVVTIDNDGKVTAIAVGTAKIWCKANDGSGVMACCKVTVDPIPPTAISIPSSMTVIIGSTITLSPTFEPANASAKLTWSSDDETIAMVNSEGVVIGLKKGQTFINVETDNGKTSYCKLTVIAPEPTTITLPEKTTLYVGETLKLAPTITPEDAETTLTWKSDDETVVRVSAEGELTGVAEGLALVSVSTANGLTSNYCKVKVEQNPDGIMPVFIENMEKDASFFILSGQRVSVPRKGVNIIRMSNGIDRKVLVK